MISGGRVDAKNEAVGLIVLMGGNGFMIGILEPETMIPLLIETRSPNDLGTWCLLK